MHCTKCQSYLCWLCERLLRNSDPYDHYSIPGNPCYMKLFHGVEGDDGFNGIEGVEGFEMDVNED